MKQYGTPCRNCNATLRYTKKNGKDAGCVACALARNKAPDKRARQKVWEKSPAGVAWHAEWKSSGRARACASRSKHKRGDTTGFPLDGYVPPKPSDGLCENPFCPNDRTPSKRGLCVDHDHDIERNNFRAWLCNECNRGQGLLGDNPAALRWCAELIERKRVA